MIRTGHDPRSHRAPGDVGRAHPRRPQSGAALRRRARRGGPGRQHRRPAAGDRRRRLGQDQHARPPRRPPDRATAPIPAASCCSPSRAARPPRWSAASSASSPPRSASRRGGARNPISWSGTFHAIGARLLRMYAHRDRPRSRLHHPRPRGLRRPDEPRAPRARALRARRSAFPLKATCLAIYSRAVNAAEPLELVLGKQFPWCAEWKDELRGCSRPMSRPSRSSTCSTTTTCCSTGAS